MSLVPYIGAAALALLAIGFVAWPVLRAQGPRRARALLLAAAALFVLAIGGGVYWMVGRPHLAMREARGMESREVNGLALPLIKRVRANPDDITAWMYLARIYMDARDADSAAAALGKAVEVTRRKHQASPSLEVAYGEMLVTAADGQVNEKAQALFTGVLAADPKNVPARYYLGMARAQKGDRPGAQQYWKTLLDEVPPDSALHQRLVDMLASLGAPTPNVAGPGGASDISAMVAGLAARLKANPADPAGWQRLIRAYAVLGDTEQAKMALATARKSPGADQAALSAQAKELKLE